MSLVASLGPWPSQQANQPFDNFDVNANGLRHDASPSTPLLRGQSVTRQQVQRALSQAQLNATYELLAGCVGLYSGYISRRASPYRFRVRFCGSISQRDKQLACEALQGCFMQYGSTSFVASHEISRNFEQTTVQQLIEPDSIHQRALTQGLLGEIYSQCLAFEQQQQQAANEQSVARRLIFVV